MEVNPVKFIRLCLTVVITVILTLLGVKFWQNVKPHERQSQTVTPRQMADTYGPYRGVVDEVHDGDTINIKLDLGFDITVYARVRVYGINAPELSTDAGKKARAYARGVLPVGTNVIVYSHGWDKYGGRIDGQITLLEPWHIDDAVLSDFADIMLVSKNAVPYRPS